MHRGIHNRDPPHPKESSFGHHPTLPVQGSWRLQPAYEKPVSPLCTLLRSGLLFTQESWHPPSSSRIIWVYLEMFCASFSYRRSCTLGFSVQYKQMDKGTKEGSQFKDSFKTDPKLK